MKMELTEGSETSAIINETPGNYPKENLLYSVQGESLESRMLDCALDRRATTLQDRHTEDNKPRQGKGQGESSRQQRWGGMT